RSIARGPDIFRPLRANAKGWDITNPPEVAELSAARAAFRDHQWVAGDPARPARPVPNPANPAEIVGTVHEAAEDDIAAAFAVAKAAQPGWEAQGAEARAAVLERAAELYEASAPELMAVAAREAGKNWLDAVGEVREACDFLRYYAAQARRAEARPARGV